MYKFYLGSMLLPVTPERIQIKAGNSSNSYTLINTGEINVLRGYRLKEFSFDFLLPNFHYPFAQYENGFQQPKVYLEELEKLRKGGKWFYFKILRVSPKGEPLFHEIYKVSLEGYSTEENAQEGFDIRVSISLKEYVEYQTKRIEIYEPSIDSGEEKTEKKAVIVEERPVSAKAPDPYTVKRGDTLWEICKLRLGDGGRYKEIAKLNGISNPNFLVVGQVIRFE